MLKRDYIKYILALILFGSNGIVASFIQLESYQIVLCRTLIGGLFLSLRLLISKKKPSFFKMKKSLVMLVLSGTAMGLSWILLFESYRLVGVSVATLAYYCGPVLVIMISPYVFREKLKISTIAGFFIVVLGMVLVNRADIAHSTISPGLIYGILSACLYAAMVIFNKKATGIEGLENSTIQLVVGCISVILFIALRGQRLSAIPQGSLFPLLFLGIINTGIGCYLYFSSIPKLSAQSVSILGYLDPLSALLFSSVILSERMNKLQWLGAFLILGGAALGELLGKNKSKTIEKTTQK